MERMREFLNNYSKNEPELLSIGYGISYDGSNATVWDINNNNTYEATIGKSDDSFVVTSKNKRFEYKALFSEKECKVIHKTVSAKDKQLETKCLSRLKAHYTFNYNGVSNGYQIIFIMIIDRTSFNLSLKTVSPDNIISTRDIRYSISDQGPSMAYATRCEHLTTAVGKLITTKTEKGLICLAKNTQLIEPKKMAINDINETIAAIYQTNIFKDLIDFAIQFLAQNYNGLEKKIRNYISCLFRYPLNNRDLQEAMRLMIEEATVDDLTPLDTILSPRVRR